MSQLPRIPSATPKEVEAIPAKEFPDWYLRNLTINATPDHPTKCSVALQAYNYDTKEADTEAGPRIEFMNLDEAAAQRAADGKPELAQALGAVLVAVAQIASEVDTTQPVIEIE